MSNECTRREFIRTSGGLALTGPAVASVAASVGETESSKPRPIRKAVKYGMVAGELPMLEKFRLLKRLGFDGVELDSPNSYDAEEVLAARDESGLTIHGVVDSAHWRDTLSDPDPAVRARGVKALETALRDAHRYGATTVLLVPAVVNESVPYDAAYERSQAEIRRVLPLAQELGVRIALENVWNNFLLSPLEAARYVDEFQSDAVGWYFDVGNVVNYGWPEQWVRILGDRIMKLDVKEYSRSKRDDEGLWRGFDVELLEGDCDWPAVMATLDQVGYSGWATAEIRGGDESRLREIADRIDRIIAL